MATTVGTLDILIRGDTASLSRSLNTANNEIQGFSRTAERNLTRTGVALTAGLTAPILGSAVAAVRAATSWESAFTGVRKTVDASESVLLRLNSQLRDLATSPDSYVAGLENAHVTLAQIAELGGQLGVDPSALSEFTDVIGQLTIATDLTAESAATMLAQYANITGLDIETELRGLGDTIVNLGNNMATTESQIVLFMQRMAGAGANIGMADTDIAAFAATAASVGLRAESAGTSFTQLAFGIEEAVASFQGGTVSADALIGSLTGVTSDLQREQTVLQRELTAAQDRYNRAVESGSASQGVYLTRVEELQAELAEVQADMASTEGRIAGITPGTLISYEQGSEALRAYAETAARSLDYAGISMEEFANLYTDDAAEAMYAFLSGFGQIEDAATQLDILDEIGLTGIRVSDLIRRMSNGSELLAEAFGFAEDSAGALAEESARRFATTEAQMFRLRNVIYDLGIVMGSVLLPPLNAFMSFISRIILGLSDLNPTAARLVWIFGGIAAAIGPIILLGSQLSGIFAVMAAAPFAVFLIGVLGSLAALTVGLSSVIDNSSLLSARFARIRDRLTGLIAPIREFIANIFTIGRAFVRALFPAFDTFDNMGFSVENLLLSFTNFANRILNFVTPAINLLARATGIVADILTTGTFDYTGLLDVFATFGMFEDSAFFRLLFGEGATGSDAIESIVDATRNLRDYMNNVTFESFIGDIYNAFLDISNQLNQLNLTQVGKDVREAFLRIVSSITDNEGVNRLAQIIGDWIVSAFSFLDSFDFTSVINGIARALGLGNLVEEALSKEDASAVSDAVGGYLLRGIANTRAKGFDFLQFIEDIKQQAKDMFGNANLLSVASVLVINLRNSINNAFDNFNPADILTSFIDFISRIKTAFMESIPSFGENIFTGFFDFLDRLNLIENKPELSTFLTNTGIAISTFLAQVAAGFALAKGVFQENTLIKGLGNIFSFISRLVSTGGIASGIGGLVGASGLPIVISTVVQLVEKLPRLIGAIQEMFANLSEGDYTGIAKVIGFIAGVIGTIFTFLGDFLSEAIIEVLPHLGTFIADFATGISELFLIFEDFGSAGEHIGEVGEGITGMVHSTWSATIDVLIALFNALGNVLTAIGVTSEDDVANFTEVVGGLFHGIIDGVFDAVEDFFNNMESRMRGFITRISNGIQGILLTILNAVNINNMFDNAISGIFENYASGQAAFSFAQLVAESIESGDTSDLIDVLRAGRITVVDALTGLTSEIPWSQFNIGAIGTEFFTQLLQGVSEGTIPASTVQGFINRLNQDLTGYLGREELELALELGINLVPTYMLPDTSTRENREERSMLMGMDGLETSSLLPDLVVAQEAILDLSIVGPSAAQWYTTVTNYMEDIQEQFIPTDRYAPDTTIEANPDDWSFMGSPTYTGQMSTIQAARELDMYAAVSVIPTLTDESAIRTFQQVGINMQDFLARTGLWFEIDAQNTYLYPSLVNQTDIIADSELQAQAAFDATTLGLDAVAALHITVGEVTIDSGVQGLVGQLQLGEIGAFTMGGRQKGGPIPYTGLYQLHAGEEVLNKHDARDYRGNRGNGGNTVIINGVQDVDGLLAELNRRGIFL